MTGAMIGALCTVGFFAFAVGCIVGMSIARCAIEHFYSNY